MRERKRQNWLKRKGNGQGMEYCEGKKKQAKKSGRKNKTERSLLTRAERENTMKQRNKRRRDYGIFGHNFFWFGLFFL